LWQGAIACANNIIIKTGQIIAILPIAIYKYDKIIAIWQIIKKIAIYKNGQIIAIL
jgi:hypothetical protein